MIGSRVYVVLSRSQYDGSRVCHLIKYNMVQFVPSTWNSSYCAYLLLETTVSPWTTGSAMDSDINYIRINDIDKYEPPKNASFLIERVGTFGNDFIEYFKLKHKRCNVFGKCLKKRS